MNERIVQYYFREIIVIFFKHKIKILFTLLTTLALLFILLGSLSSSYLATATVMVKLGREFIPVSEVGEFRSPVLNQDSIIHTEAQIITSRDLGGRVVDAIGAGVMYPDVRRLKLGPAFEREQAMDRFGTDLSATWIKGTNLISVSFSHKNREIAARSVNLLLDFFKERHLEIFSDPKSSFIEHQARVYGERLRDAQNSLTNYKQQHGLFAVDDQRSVTIRQLEQLEEAINREQTRLRESQTQGPTSTSNEGPVADHVLNQLQLQLSSLEQKEQQITDKYSDTSQFVLNARKEIQVVKQQIQDRAKEARKLEAIRIASQMDPIRIRIADLSRYRNELQRRLETMDQKTMGLQNLKREVAINEDNYNTYMRKLEEANLAAELDRKKMTNIKIVQNAVVSPTPNSAKQPKKIAVYLALCLGIAFGTGLLFEFLPQKVTTPERLEKVLGVPVLAAIPRGNVLPARH